MKATVDQLQERSKMTASSNRKHTILGAGGAIGTELAKELRHYTDNIRLVSRHPQKVNMTDEFFPADLSVAAQVDNAIKGSDVVYLTLGFAYNTRIWQKMWPPLMQRVIAACKKHQSKLVFFDNVYMYDRTHLAHMTEETPVRPTSKKGEIRAEIAQLLLTEVQHGNLTALIARSADFYGPTNSVLVEMIYKNLLQGKRAVWIADINTIHNFTFTPDAAKATAILGNTPEAFNQVWHLPTDRSPLTVKHWIELFTHIVPANPKVTVLPIWSLSILGMFMPLMREFKEMSYQYDRDYLFDSRKFEQRFDFTPTRPEEGVKWVVNTLQEK
jgi:nucleoside-diphosphate-sugar epimerase